MPNTEPSPADVTAEYQPAGAPVGRPPLVVASGSGVGTAEDLRSLLQRRLRFLCPLLVVLYAVASVFVVSRSSWSQIGWPGWSVFACLVVSAVLAGLVWTRRSRSLAQLRAIELVVVAMLATRIIARLYLSFWSPDAQAAFQTWRETGAEQILREQIGQAAFEVCLTAAIYIVAYGVCIPNTWRRCVVIVASLWGIVPVLWVTGCAANDLPRAVWFGPDFRAALLDLTFAAALSVYGSHRVERLRQEALQARRFGQYVLRHRLGAGGMGEVYLADHVLLRRPCAIKLIRPDRAGDPETIQRFEREVQATATLTHPNTVQVFDYGRTQDGRFYYVMEYLPGPTLEELVRSDGPLPPGRTVHFLRHLCGALNEAHAIGLIHRDLKPRNVIVCERGGTYDVVKLLDFGVAQRHFTGDGDGPLTERGTVVGTPEFLSPEQAGGSDVVDARSDIYSLGAVAYFLLSGQPPFGGRSKLKMLAAHQYEPPAPLSKHRPDVPADLEAAVLKCLAKDPADRFPDVRTLADALAACAWAQPWTDAAAAEWWRSRPGS
ncbi:MAG TPA: serine/threonine-protein kinase [Gemmataceae bacterium]|nr:serine/threonine-protein kinase [Gemmataceae bacterium]